MGVREQIQRIEAAKYDIIGAIYNKGVTVTGDEMIDELPPLIASIETGSSDIQVVRGEFNTSGKNATEDYVDVTFPTELLGTPTLIVFWQSSTLNKTGLVRGGFGMSNNMTPIGTCCQITLYNSSKDTTITGEDKEPITSKSGICIRNAKSTGCRFYRHSSFYPLYGTYNYIAVYAPSE